MNPTLNCRQRYESQHGSPGAKDVLLNPRGQKRFDDRF